MFGVVPRTLWEKRAAPDRENRISLALNCYLVRGRGTTVLVETGVGPDVDRRYVDFYSFRREPGLCRRLEERGSGRRTWISSSIPISISTTAAATPSGPGKGPGSRPSRSARYVVQRGEWEQALHPVERDKPSYIPARLEAARAAGLSNLLDGDAEVCGRRRGHSRPRPYGFPPGPQGLLRRPDVLLFSETPSPPRPTSTCRYIMSYDLFPVGDLQQQEEALRTGRAGRLDRRLQPRPPPGLRIAPASPAAATNSCLSSLNGRSRPDGACCSTDAPFCETARKGLTFRTRFL